MTDYSNFDEETQTGTILGPEVYQEGYGMTQWAVVMEDGKVVSSGFFSEEGITMEPQKSQTNILAWQATQPAGSSWVKFEVKVDYDKAITYVYNTDDGIVTKP